MSDISVSDAVTVADAPALYVPVGLPVFEHCDYVEAAPLTELGDAQVALSVQYLQFNDLPMNSAVPFRRGLVGSVYAQGDRFAVRHVHRGLHFVGAGSLADTESGANDDVTLSENLDGRGRVDLSAISWLFPGKMYWVIGVDVCIEDDDA